MTIIFHNTTMSNINIRFMVYRRLFVIMFIILANSTLCTGLFMQVFLLAILDTECLGIGAPATS